jgi:1,4-alpha-glucan branching enzyme
VSEGRAVFRLRAPEANSASVTGSFNGWEDPGASLEGPDADGMWTLELDLPPGRYEVIYLVDGKSVTPDGAPSYQDDGFGGRNAVIVVP